MFTHKKEAFQTSIFKELQEIITKLFEWGSD
jgi:hypothetical protein